MRDLRREQKERKVQTIGRKSPHALEAKADRGERPPRGKRCKVEVLQLVEHQLCFQREHMSWTTSTSLGEQPIFRITNKVEQLRGL